MLRTLFVFLVGVYVGQEYGDNIPNIKRYTNNILEKFKDTDIYKNISEEIKKNK